MKDKTIQIKDSMSVKEKWIRLAAMIFFIAVAAAAFTYLVFFFFSGETGYVDISDTSGKASCGSEFVLTYQLGVSGTSPLAEKKAVTALYSEKVVYYYQLFHTAETFDGVTNMASLNRAVNRDLTVPSGLYEALAKAAADPGRNLYLAPIYAYYETLFASSYDEDAAAWDPARNDALREEYAQALAFIASDEHVSLQLKKNNVVRLTVSKDYLAFADRVGYTAFVDFAWMKNAFIADLLARDLTDAGYTHGTLSSLDGFARNLDPAETEYAYEFYCSQRQIGGTLAYSGAAALVTFHDFVLDPWEENLTYQYADGTRVTRYITAEDGLPHDASGAVTVYSKTLDCADLLLAALPAYTADAAKDLARPDVGVIWFDGKTVRNTPLDGFTFSKAR